VRVLTVVTLREGSIRSPGPPPVQVEVMGGRGSSDI